MNIHAGEQTPAPHDNPAHWAAVVANCEESGIAIEQILATIRLCAEKQVSAEDAKDILNPVCTIKNDPTMHTLLLEKVEEGISKKADVSAIQTAVIKRRQYVMSAQRILSFNYANTKPQELVSAVTYALESGLPPLLLTTIVQKGYNLSPDKLRASIESAELLHLAGTAEAKTQELVIQQMNRKALAK